MRRFLLAYWPPLMGIALGMGMLLWFHEVGIKQIVDREIRNSQLVEYQTAEMFRTWVAARSYYTYDVVYDDAENVVMRDAFEFVVLGKVVE